MLLSQIKRGCKDNKTTKGNVQCEVFDWVLIRKPLGRLLGKIECEQR